MDAWTHGRMYREIGKWQRCTCEYVYMN
jgi:hypothetical protein